MTASTERATDAGASEARRAGREVLLELVFRPAANALVPFLVRARLSPPAVVLANAAVGLLAALALWHGQLIQAAVLLQAKTLLDNADGQLARVTGRVTLTGRYLDTVADLAVNASLFVALGHVTGRPLLAAVAFVALTLVLAADFNASELYREANGPAVAPPATTGSWPERLLGAVYSALFAPLDRALRSLAARRRVAYDATTVTVLANLGLTTQLAVLGLCLVLGVPSVYLWTVVGCLFALIPLQLRAERRARDAIAS